MNSKTTSMILGGCAIALGALGLALLRGPDGAAPAAGPVREDRRALVAAVAPVAQLSAIPARRWEPGTTYVYEIESDRSLAVRGGADAGPPRTLGSAGRLSIAVVGSVEGGSLLRFALVERGSGARPRAFYAVAAPSGALAAFQFPRGLASVERATLKGLASALQLVVPEAGGPAWRTLEEDATGEYEAAYRAEGGQIHKAKERFVRARGPEGLRAIADPSQYRVVSAAAFELDASGWPRTVAEDEALTVQAGALVVEARIRTRAALAAIEESPDLAPDLARLAAEEQAALEPEPERDAAGFAEARRRADEGLVAGADYGALAADLGAADGKARNRAMARLAALVRLRPETAAQAAGAVVRGEVAGEPAKRLLGALGGAGTAAAQAALAGVIATEGAPAELRADAASSLGLAPRPTADSARALAAAADAADPDLAGAALLGLGTVSRRLREAGGDAAGAIAGLAQRLAAATDDAARILCLDALGNSGDPAALSAIEPYLGHADAAVRAAAVQALRFLPGVEVQLAAGLSDGAARVRQAAAGALAHREIAPLLSAVTLLLQRDPDAGTRLALVGSLQLRKRREAGLAALLAWSAAHDPAPEVRRAAGGA